MNKGYMYFAMAFALVVECLNIRVPRLRSDKTVASQRKSEVLSPRAIRQRTGVSRACMFRVLSTLKRNDIELSTGK